MPFACYPLINTMLILYNYSIPISCFGSHIIMLYLISFILTSVLALHKLTKSPLLVCIILCQSILHNLTKHLITFNALSHITIHQLQYIPTENNAYQRSLYIVYYCLSLSVLAISNKCILYHKNKACLITQTSRSSYNLFCYYIFNANIISSHSFVVLFIPLCISIFMKFQCLTVYVIQSLTA